MATPETTTYLLLSLIAGVILFVSLFPRGVMYLYNSTEGRVKSFVRRESRRFIIGLVSFISLIGLIVTILNVIK